MSARRPETSRAMVDTVIPFLWPVDRYTRQAQLRGTATPDMQMKRAILALHRFICGNMALSRETGVEPLVSIHPNSLSQTRERRMIQISETFWDFTGNPGAIFKAKDVEKFYAVVNKYFIDADPDPTRGNLRLRLRRSTDPKSEIPFICSAFRFEATPEWCNIQSVPIGVLELLKVGVNILDDGSRKHIIFGGNGMFRFDLDTATVINLDTNEKVEYDRTDLYPQGGAETNVQLFSNNPWRSEPATGGRRRRRRTRSRTPKSTPRRSVSRRKRTSRRAK